MNFSFELFRFVDSFQLIFNCFFDSIFLLSIFILYFVYCCVVSTAYFLKQFELVYLRLVLSLNLFACIIMLRPISFLTILTTIVNRSTSRANFKIFIFNFTIVTLLHLLIIIQTKKRFKSLNANKNSNTNKIKETYLNFLCIYVLLFEFSSLLFLRENLLYF